MLARPPAPRSPLGETFGAAARDFCSRVVAPALFDDRLRFEEVGRVDAGEDYRAPEWRDAQAYAPLLDADRSLFAWEWLRRDPLYRAAALGALSEEAGRESARPQAWGLCAFEHPDLAAPRARPVWTADACPHVLQAEGAPSSDPADSFDIERFRGISTIIPGSDGGEHLLISDGLRTIRVDVWPRSLAAGPAQLRYRLAGFASVERPLLTLRRLLALQRNGRFSRALHAREARTRRWQLLLRAHDALAAGADQREIAAELLSDAAAGARWRVRAASVRSQVQRLVRSARDMAAGGFRALLR